LFAEQGFQKTSLRQIADRLGFTKAALYYYFPAKDDLLVSLVNPVLDAVENLLARARVDNSRDQRTLLESLADILLDHRKVVALLTNDLSTRSHDDLGPRISRLQKRLRALLAGPNPDVSAKLGAAGVIAVLQAAAVEFPNTDGQAIREASVTTAGLVMDALGMGGAKRPARPEIQAGRRSSTKGH
jgi:AcrR family transcriptional regulator